MTCLEGLLEGSREVREGKARKETQRVAIRSTGSGLRPPGFQFWLCDFLSCEILDRFFHFIVSVSFFICTMEVIIVQPHFKVLSKLLYVKYLEWVTIFVSIFTVFRTVGLEQRVAQVFFQHVDTKLQIMDSVLRSVRIGGITLQDLSVLHPWFYTLQITHGI